MERNLHFELCTVKKGVKKTSKDTTFTVEYTAATDGTPEISKEKLTFYNTLFQLKISGYTPYFGSEKLRNFEHLLSISGIGVNTSARLAHEKARFDKKFEAAKAEWVGKTIAPYFGTVHNNGTTLYFPKNEMHWDYTYTVVGLENLGNGEFNVLVKKKERAIWENTYEFSSALNPLVNRELSGWVPKIACTFTCKNSKNRRNVNYFTSLSEIPEIYGFDMGKLSRDFNEFSGKLAEEKSKFDAETERIKTLKKANLPYWGYDDSVKEYPIMHGVFLEWVRNDYYVAENQQAAKVEWIKRYGFTRVNGRWVDKDGKTYIDGKGYVGRQKAYNKVAFDIALTLKPEKPSPELIARIFGALRGYKKAIEKLKKAGLHLKTWTLESCDSEYYTSFSIEAYTELDAKTQAFELCPKESDMLAYDNYYEIEQHPSELSLIEIWGEDFENLIEIKGRKITHKQ